MTFKILTFFKWLYLTPIKISVITQSNRTLAREALVYITELNAVIDSA